MQQKDFNAQHYLTALIEQIKSRIATNNKLYLEVTGNLIDHSDSTAIFPLREPDTYKKAFAPFKYDMEVLLCVKAQDIIDNLPRGEDQKPFRDYLRMYLKKIENQF